MSENVIQLPSRGESIVTKRQLAAKLGRSERWVEGKCKEGMPVLEQTDRWGRRLYNLGAVEAFLREKPAPRRSLEGRVTDLERQMSKLLERTG